MEAAHNLGQVAGITLLERVGQGGSGLVYRGHHPVMAIDVAVKIIDLQHIDRHRFQQEARLAARIQHPHVVTLHNAGEEDGSAYLIMEWVPGGDCERQIAEQGTIPWRQACTWIRDAARGLGAAHDLAIVHRDIKPANLLLGDDKSVKVADLGLARIEPWRSQDSVSNSLTGTVGYMAPEQIAEPGRIGPATDVYALGISLFEMIAGQLPFDYNHSGELLAAHLQHAPPALRDKHPQIPDRLGALVKRMLAKDPDQRPANGQAVADALDRILERYGTESEVPARRLPWSAIPLLLIPVIAMIVATSTLIRPATDTTKAHDILLPPTRIIHWGMVSTAEPDQVDLTTKELLLAAGKQLQWKHCLTMQVSDERELNRLRGVLLQSQSLDILTSIDANHNLIVAVNDGHRHILPIKALDSADTLAQHLLQACNHLTLHCQVRTGDPAWQLSIGFAHGVHVGDIFTPYGRQSPRLQVQSSNATTAQATLLDHSTTPLTQTRIWSRMTSGPHGGP